MKRSSISIAICIVVVLQFSSLYGQEQGDRVRLMSSNQRGVPVHPAAGDNSYVRWENGTIATIEGIDNATGWFRVSSGGREGWVTRRYITIIGEDEPPEEEITTLVVGCWNLEHFNDGRTRGFPEYRWGGPTYPSRTDEDFRFIADVIETHLNASLLILSEIDGQNSGRSDELDRLVSLLGDNWAYELGRSGDPQRLAVIYDTDRLFRGVCTDFVVPERRVQGADIFARDPLACMFTCLDENGQEQNDFIVVGLHLASGQRNNRNHNEAMSVLENRLEQALANGTFPQGENDILIMGDLNANRYDSSEENFWEGYDVDNLNFLTLSPADGEEYPGTRLSGVPLYPRSKIDYILASGAANGMTSSIVQLIANVHTELLVIGFDDFRRQASDHIPVTIRVRVMDDDD